jgi:long-subunit acyl-CoA synthetase (AMP-forming)
MLAGCTVTIIDPYSNAEIIGKQLILCKTKIIITSKKLQFLSRIPFVDIFTTYRKRILISRLTKYKTVCFSDIESNSNYEETHKLKYENNTILAYIPTSGTTDNPKVVVHTYRSFFSSIKRLQSIPID